MTIDERIKKVKAKISELQDELDRLEDLRNNNEVGDILKYSKD